MKPPGPLPGSDFYYATLYVPAARRQQLAAINALKEELCAIPLTVSDPGVARVKLEWWREEAERLLQGQPRHPLTQAYHASYQADSAIREALCALAAGLDDELGGRWLATRDDQRVWFDATFGPLYAEYAAVASGTREPSPAPQALGRVIEIGRSLLQLKPLTERRLRRFPAADLAASGCTWDDIEAGRRTAALVDLLETQTRFAIENITDVLDHSPRRIQRTHRPLFTLARIVQQTLIEMKKDGYRVWQHRIELTPLHKLWLAWRMRFR